MKILGCKKIIITVALCIVAIIVLTPIVDVYFKHEEPRVYITQTGSKYHSRNCSYLRTSAIPIGLYEAVNQGYTVCSVCGGQANGTITVNGYVSSFYISTGAVALLVLLSVAIHRKFCTK